MPLDLRREELAVRAHQNFVKRQNEVGYESHSRAAKPSQKSRLIQCFLVFVQMSSRYLFLLILYFHIC